MPNGGGSAQQDLVYNLRVTADMEGARLASQSFQQLSKQTERSANEMARAFGPRLTTGMKAVQQRLIEQGKASIAFGQSLDQVAPSLGKHRKELTSLGVSLQAAGVSAKGTGAAVRESGEVYNRLSTTIANTTKWYTAYRVRMDEAIQAERNKQTAGLQTAEVTKQNIANMQQWNAVADEQIRRLREAAAVTGQAGVQSAVFGKQVKTATDTMGSFTGEATMAQKAGQGMILSFSGAQAAAGNYQQALFGLGFSMMFVGKAMLGWPLIIGAAATAMTVGIPKLIEWMKSTDEAAEALKRFEEASGAASERLQEITTALAGSQGELVAIAKGLATIMEEEGTAAGVTGASLVTLTAFTEELSSANKDLMDDYGLIQGRLQEVRRMFGQNVEGTEELESALSTLAGEIQTNAQALKILEAVQADNIVTVNEYMQVLKDVPGAAEKLTEITDEVTAAMRRQASAIRDEALEALADYDKEVAQAAEREAVIEPFKLNIEGVRDDYEALVDAARDAASDATDAVQEGLKAQTQAIRDGLKEQTTAMRDAARDRQDAIREAMQDEVAEIRDAAQDRQDAIREGLRDETDMIRDAAGERIDNIRDQLQDELDAIRDAAADRVDAIKDAASDEIDIHKDRISELRELERGLTAELRDLASLRQELVGEAMTTQAELAALEAAQAQFGGDDPRLAGEIALRKARLEALGIQDAEAQAQEQAAAVQLSAAQAQIESEEAIIEAIEDRRDAEIEAVQDAADAAKDAAKDVADARIKHEERARDAAIDAAQDAAKEKIKADQRATDIAIGLVQDAAKEKIKEDQKATDAAVTEATREANTKITENQRVAADQIENINEVRDAAVEALGLEEEARVDNITRAQEQAVEDLERARILEDEVLPGLRDEWVLRDQILQLQIASTTDEQAKAAMQRERNRLLANYLSLRSGIAGGPAYDISVPFQQGGIVPGPSSRAVPITAHGGEAILRPDQFRLLAQLAARGMTQPVASQPASSGPVSVIINVNAGSAQDMHKLERTLDRALGKRADLTTRTRKGVGR